MSTCPLGSSLVELCTLPVNKTYSGLLLELLIVVEAGNSDPILVGFDTEFILGSFRWAGRKGGEIVRVKGFDASGLVVFIRVRSPTAEAAVCTAATPQLDSYVL